MLAAYGRVDSMAAQEANMAFRVNTQVRAAGNRSGEVFELVDDDQTIRAEVWPHLGFNCLHWQVRDRSDRLSDVFHVAPDWEQNPVPTRSGHPILFPFPGRFRHGTFSFLGKRYVLPLNDSTNQHAIHGFTPRNPWRIIQSGTTRDQAFATAEFCLSRDLPTARACWPADFLLAVTYGLLRDRLRVEARVENPGPGPLPCGMGYHPYFHLPGTTDPGIDGHLLSARVGEVWDTVELLPTGTRSPIPRHLDFRDSRPIEGVELDHVFTRVQCPEDTASALSTVAELAHPNASGRLRILAGPQFRELVLFIPPHRKAVAIEPYTCSADAANLAERCIDSGWIIIPPNGTWQSVVEYQWIPLS
jgi:aldose 1-epimerase